MPIRNFRVAIDQSDLDDLQRRLRSARWDRPAPDLGWPVGIEDGFLRRLVGLHSDLVDEVERELR